MVIIQPDFLVLVFASYVQLFGDPYGLPCDLLSLFHQQYTGTKALYKLMKLFIKNKIAYLRPEELWYPTGKWLCGACVRFLPSEREGVGGTVDENK